MQIIVHDCYTLSELNIMQQIVFCTFFMDLLMFSHIHRTHPKFDNEN